MNKNQSIGMYIVLGIMVMAFLSMLFAGPTSTTEELSYTNFLQKLEQKEIKSVDLSRDFLIALPEKQPEAKPVAETKNSLGINNWFDDNNKGHISTEEDDDYLNDVISILKRNSGK